MGHRVLDSRSLHWLAGLLEAEGCFTRLGDGPKIRGHGVNIQLEMTDEDVIIRARDILRPGGGYVTLKTRNLKHKTSFRLTITGTRAIGWLMTLYPLMSVRRQSRISELIAFWKKRPTLRKRRAEPIQKFGVGIDKRPIEQCEKDLYWLAGLMEGDGCFSVSARKEITIAVQMTDRESVNRVHSLISNDRSRKIVRREKPNNSKNCQPTYTSQISKRSQVVKIMLQLYPLMSMRRKSQIDLCLSTASIPQFTTGC